MHPSMALDVRYVISLNSAIRIGDSHSPYDEQVIIGARVRMGVSRWDVVLKKLIGTVRTSLSVTMWESEVRQKSEMRVPNGGWSIDLSFDTF